MPQNIKSISIQNIKGIGSKTFNLDILPNKPSIIVAPNGFGKSSLAIAFQSLNNNRIDLDNDNFHQNNDANKPSLQITYEQANGTIITLSADSSNNTIKDEFDYFVINSKLEASAVRQTYGGRTNVSASLNIKPIVLIDSIPAAEDFGYSITQARQTFGQNGRILNNLTDCFNNPALIRYLSENYVLLGALEGVRIAQKTTAILDRLNSQHGTTENLVAWAEINELQNLESITPLLSLANGIQGCGLGFTSRVNYLLSAIQLANLFNSDRNKFKRAIKRKSYEFEKADNIKSFLAFNATWQDIRPKERNGKLIVEFPKAHHISNGQRDILCVISLLVLAKRRLKKGKCILIIDEVFDYLDDANLVAAQYYISNIIDEFKEADREFYPLILTHLNPSYFKNYAFNKQKVYYLDQRNPVNSQHFSNLIRHRGDPTISTEVDRYLFHYDPGQINKRIEFRTLGLPERWGEADHFDVYLQAEIQKYLNDQPNFDAFAICCAVRVKIEEKIYNEIAVAANRVIFLGTHTTTAKLEYAEQIGVKVPEYYYLLGLIYNEGLHWRNGVDNFSPIAAKLENGVIRNIIAEVFR